MESANRPNDLVVSLISRHATAVHQAILEPFGAITVACGEPHWPADFASTSVPSNALRLANIRRIDRHGRARRTLREIHCPTHGMHC